MGKSPSPIVADLFMSDLEHVALLTSPLVPKLFVRYVDDCFMIWPHGKAALDEFVSHINNRHPSIKFTMELEKDGRLPFLDVLVFHQNAGISTTVYRKASYSGRFIPFQSFHDYACT